MQSTVSSSSVSAPNSVERWNDLLNRSAIDEDFDTQAETSMKMPVLSGISLAQQQRRMRQRPHSLSGVEVAESNRFEVFSDALMETCNYPSIFSALKAHSTRTNPSATFTDIQELFGDSIQIPSKSLGDSIQLPSKPLELGFDFADRAWPSYEADVQEQQPAPTVTQSALSNWNMSSHKPRISAVLTRTPSTIADLDSLRAIVDEARNRDAQRITAKLRIISPRRPNDRIGHAIDAVRALVARIRMQCSVLRTYFMHANNRENFSISE